MLKLDLVWIRNHFNTMEPNDKDIKGEDFFITENQAYRVLTYFHNRRKEDGEYYFDVLARVSDSAYLHERAFSLAHEIVSYKEHKLRPAVKELVDKLPAYLLF